MMGCRAPSHGTGWIMVRTAGYAGCAGCLSHFTGLGQASHSLTFTTIDQSNSCYGRVVLLLALSPIKLVLPDPLVCTGLLGR